MSPGSIASCALLLAVAAAAAVPSAARRPGDAEPLRPIVSAAQARRICAALCLAGLGGRTCGSGCLDLTPADLPRQSARNASRDPQQQQQEQQSPATSSPSMARRDVCPVLCANGLGRPLCDCEGVEASAEEPDYVQVCGHLCVRFGYRIAGCQSCEAYREAAKDREDGFALAAYDRSLKTVDWNEWCRQMCSVGEGGPACNCDILPMSLPVD